MKTKVSALFAATSVLLLVSACGGTAPRGSSKGTNDSGSSGSSKQKKVALVIAQGGLGDEAYNDLAYKGFKKATKKYGIDGKPIESKDIVAQGKQILRTAAGSGYGLVADLEYSHEQTLKKVAPDFPKVQFAIVNTVVKAPNVTSIMFKEHEGSYLAGVLAALQTQNTKDPKINAKNRIGFIGGSKSAGIDKFLIGYEQGARSVDPKIKVDVKYANSFGDAAKGKQIAKQMYANGDDIIYGVAGGTGAGIIQAAKDTKHYAIGVDSDQDDIAPGFVLTSMIKKTNIAIANLVKSYATGDLKGGKTIEYGLKDNGVGLSPMKYTKKAIDPTTLAKVEKAKKGIIDGEIKVWDVTKRGYPKWAQ